MDKELKNIVEALLFVATDPLTLRQLVQLCSSEQQPVSETAVQSVLEQLAVERATSGVILKEIAGGWQLFTAEQYVGYVEKYCQPQVQQLSKAALETLAIIAYRQPITRQEIEAIRQVDPGAMVNKLLDKQLIKELGRKEALGHPMLYGTTEQFLAFLGLRSLQELPPLENFLSAHAGEERETTN